MGIYDHYARTPEDVAAYEAARQAELEREQRWLDAKANGCPTGYCDDHKHGSRYYLCLCCYGD